MSTSHIRIFTAFPIETTESLAHAIKRTRINAQQKEMELNWIPDANFHVTLNFLGSTERTRLEELNNLLASVTSQTPPFETSLRGMGGFPDDRHMRTLWVGVRKTRALQELQVRLREALMSSGFPQEEREYSPHLTIAKTRKARSVTDLISPNVRTNFGDVEIQSVFLFESVLVGPHPEYKILNSFPLKNSSSP
jgi:2'-5' RNA ligase